jgi:hypothetical protein
LLYDRPTSYEQFYASESRMDGPIAFTHRLPQEVPNGIYLVRDGRDAVHSLLRFVVTPEYRSRVADAVRTDPRELLALPGFLDRRIHEWRDHVRSYLEDSRPWYLVRYENLAGPTKRDTIADLAGHLGIELSARRLSEILAATTIDVCREAAPGHVHEGRAGNAGTLLSPELLEHFEHEAGAELRALGYPTREASRVQSGERGLAAAIIA